MAVPQTKTQPTAGAATGQWPMRDAACAMRISRVPTPHSGTPTHKIERRARGAALQIKSVSLHQPPRLIVSEALTKNTVSKDLLAVL